jgi:hypothetical protein
MTLPAELFQVIALPRHIKGSPLLRESRCYTWSPGAVSLLRRLGGVLSEFDSPNVFHLGSRGGYDYTYSLNCVRQFDAPIVRDIAALTKKLMCIQPPARVIFFSGLIDEHVTGEVVHYLFAIMRDVIAGILESPWAALYAPLASLGDDAGDFPLHCDLYIPEMLWNIFEDVPTDGSGAAVFLETATMLRLMKQVDSLPASTVRAVQRCLTTRSKRDRYEWFYDVLYGEEHPWTGELARHMMREQIRVSLAKGDGYLIHDRTWMHGRETPSSAVSARRVHRLVFDTLESRVKRPDH